MNIVKIAQHSESIKDFAYMAFWDLLYKVDVFGVWTER